MQWTFRGRHRIEFSVDQDWQTYWTDHPSPDESWTFTDAAGHVHRYDHGYPSLEWVVEERHWCNGTEGLYNHDGHWVDDVAHYECKVCREHVVPATHPPGRAFTVPGQRTSTAVGYRTDGSRITCSPNEEETEALVALLQAEDDDGVQRWLDQFPAERIIVMEYGSR